MKAILSASTLVLLASGVFAATPIHHYNFQHHILNRTGVVDSVGSADGTFLNGATDVSGMLVLDGMDDYVQFGEPLVPTTGSFSVAFFAQEFSPTSDRMEIISQGCSYCPGFYVGYYPSPMMRVGDEWQNTGVPFPNDGLFHHYAVTADDNETRLYIDGNLVATNPPIHLSGYGDATRLGMQFQSWGENFHGNIDELWIFSGALTDGEVKVLAAINVPPIVSGLIAQLNDSSLSAQKKRPLLTMLEAAQTAFNRGHCETGIHHLETFQKKVHAQLGLNSAAQAEVLVAAAQAIINHGCGQLLTSEPNPASNHKL